MTMFEQGFVDKCASYGVDPIKLAQAVFPKTQNLTKVSPTGIPYSHRFGTYVREDGIGRSSYTSKTNGVKNPALPSGTIKR